MFLFLLSAYFLVLNALIKKKKFLLDRDIFWEYNSLR
ncbi:hypothetical protein HRbin13_00055 [bacterium HR13]|nr:hypothetical protein HRbin13_00055 [bacterium HR13]